MPIGFPGGGDSETEPNPAKCQPLAIPGRCERNVLRCAFGKLPGAAMPGLPASKTERCSYSTRTAHTASKKSRTSHGPLRLRWAGVLESEGVLK